MKAMRNHVVRSFLQVEYVFTVTRARFYIMICIYSNRHFSAQHFNMSVPSCPVLTPDENRFLIWLPVLHLISIPLQPSLELALLHWLYFCSHTLLYIDSVLSDWREDCIVLKCRNYFHILVPFS